MELGIAGLVLFVALCVLLVRGLRKLRAHATALRAQHPEAKTEEILTGHMLAMLAGVLVTGTFLSNAYYPLMYMSLGIAAAALIGSPLTATMPATQPAPTSYMHPRARRRLRTFPGSPLAG
jgi:drug/metabolite transporter (DMT)-like permease